MRVTIFYITQKGFQVSRRIGYLYPQSVVKKFNKEDVCKAWNESDLLIFVMATGIVVRTVSELVRDKRKDPAVVVIDDSARYVISLLGGHLGGANAFTKEIAELTGAAPVITTSSDVNGLPSIDIWADKNGLFIEDPKRLPSVMRRLIDMGYLNIYTDIDNISMPAGFVRVAEPSSADILVTNRIYHGKDYLYLRPRNLVVGIGCNSGTLSVEIEDAVREVFVSNNLSFNSIKVIATIDLKKNEEGLIEFMKRYGFELMTFTSDELNSVDGLEGSIEVFRATGAYGVAEPSALLASQSGRLLVPKRRFSNVTVAVAESLDYKPKKKGRLYIVGTGPGSTKHITYRAMEVLRDSEIIIGYQRYIELIRDIVRDKEIFTTGMTEEVSRCRKAVEFAMEGKIVSLISGGDPGIYAMAGLVFEILESQDLKVGNQEILNIEVIPGISALNACAARLGAPLMHDFAVISLSDRLTPWSLIERRIRIAGEGDFVIVFFNPKSTGRQEHISIARDIILDYRSPATPVGIVRGAMRDDEEVIITDLKHMLDYDIDMQTTVFIGNSRTFKWKDRMITPRGYEITKEHRVTDTREMKKGVAFLWDESLLWGLMAYKTLMRAGLDFELITSDDIRSGLLKDYRMLFVPGGWASNKLKRLGEDGVNAIRDFVRSGGSYFGICGGAGLATMEGIGLLKIKRKPNYERVPSFSGRIRVNIREHPLWNEVPPHSSFHAWWPSQFSINGDGVDIIARFSDALSDSFSSDLNIDDIVLHGGWKRFEDIYGINLDPERLKDDPAVVEGVYGEGRVLLSLLHFDTLNDHIGMKVLKNIWGYLVGSDFIKNERPVNFNPPVKFFKNDILWELFNPVSQLIDFGIRNFLWFWRNDMILQWRRGVRGLEYCTLYILLKEVSYILSSNLRDVKRDIKEEILDLRNMIDCFCEKARRLLILEKKEIEKRSISFSETGNVEIDSLRRELFSLSKSHGGMFKEIIDRVDALLFRLLRSQHPSS